MVAAEGGVVVALDTVITPSLRAEGLAREMVRRIQDLRKAAGLDIADRVITTYSASPVLADAIVKYQDYIRAETLSLDLLEGSPPEGAAVANDSFDGESVGLGLIKASPPSAGHPGARSPGEGEAAEQAIAAELASPGPDAGLAAASPMPYGHTPETRAQETNASAGRRKRAAHNATAKKATLKKPGNKAPVNKPAAKKPAAKKSLRKSATKKTAARKSVAKPTTRGAKAKKSSTKKRAVKSSAARKTSAKKAARRDATKKPAARKSARKTSR